MSYWAHHPELLEQITVEALPPKWKKKVENEEIELLEVPVDILYKAMAEAEKEYWASKVDAVRDMMKGGMLTKTGETSDGKETDQEESVRVS